MLFSYLSIALVINRNSTNELPRKWKYVFTNFHLNLVQSLNIIKIKMLMQNHAEITCNKLVESINENKN